MVVGRGSIGISGFGKGENWKMEIKREGWLCGEGLGEGVVWCGVVWWGVRGRRTVRRDIER